MEEMIRAEKMKGRKSGQDKERRWAGLTWRDPRCPVCWQYGNLGQSVSVFSMKFCQERRKEKCVVRRPGALSPIRPRQAHYAEAIRYNYTLT